MTDARPELRYMFSIDAPFAARWLGKTPAGYRIDLDYNSNLADGGGDNPDALVATDYPTLFKDWPGTQKAFDAEVARLDADTNASLRKRAEELTRSDPGATPRLYVQLQFDEARRRLAKAPAAPGLPWLGLKGDLASGMDWAVLRPDGVVDFDGRLTLRDEEGLLINAVVLGSVDMVKTGEKPPLTLDQAADRLNLRKQDEIAFALTFRFEAAQTPEPWAAKRYRQSGSGALRYRKLSQGQFLGAGVLKSFVDADPCFHVDVFWVEPPKCALGALNRRDYAVGRKKP